MKSLDIKVALRAAIVAVVSSTCAAAAVNAAEPLQATPFGPGPQAAASALQSVLNKNQVHLRGQAVEMSAKMRFALGSMLGMPGAQARMTAADVASIQAFFRTQPDLRQAGAILDEMCADLKQQDSAGVRASFPLAYSLATSLDKSEQETERATLAHYTRQLNSLSPAAKQVYEEAMNTITDANIGSGGLDYFGLAADAPQYLVDLMRAGCARRANPSEEPPIGLVRLPVPPSAMSNE